MDIETIIFKNISKRIVEARKYKEMRQNQLIANLELQGVTIDRQRLSAIENCKIDKNKNPYLMTSKQVRGISEALNVPIAELIWGSRQERLNWIKIFLLRVIVNGQNVSPFIDSSTSPEEMLAIFYLLNRTELEKSTGKTLANVISESQKDEEKSKTFFQNYISSIIGNDFFQLTSNYEKFELLNNASRKEFDEVSNTFTRILFGSKRFSDRLINIQYDYSKKGKIKLAIPYNDSSRIFKFNLETNRKNFDSLKEVLGDDIANSQFKSLIDLLDKTKQTYLKQDFEPLTLEKIKNFWKDEKVNLYSFFGNCRGVIYLEFLKAFNEAVNKYQKELISYFDKNFFNDTNLKKISSKEINNRLAAGGFSYLIRRIYNLDQLNTERIDNHNAMRDIMQLLSVESKLNNGIESESKKYNRVQLLLDMEQLRNNLNVVKNDELIPLFLGNYGKVYEENDYFE